MIGEMLLWAKGVPRDLDKAYSWLSKASTNNNENAGELILLMQGLGWGTRQVKERMLDYYKSQRGVNEIPENVKEVILQALAETAVNESERDPSGPTLADPPGGDLPGRPCSLSRSRVCLPASTRVRIRAAVSCQIPQAVEATSPTPNRSSPSSCA